MPAFANKKVAQLIGEENFQSWKQQFLLSVRGFNLEDHLLGMTVPQFFQDANGVNAPNPTYAKYV